ncbi:hypothetical protein SAMN05192552_10651, partial [Natrinema hispanicum]
MTNNWSDRVAAADDSRTQRSVDERLQDIGPLSGGWLPLTKQAAEVVDKTTSAAGLVTHLDVSQYCRADPIPHWHDSKPFEPMLRAILLKELEDASDGWLHRTL